MDRTSTHVPFGYTPLEQTTKGTLFLYDSFELHQQDDGSLLENQRSGTFDALSEADLVRFISWAERRMINRVVLYVPHEETLKRAGIPNPSPMHKREAGLREITDRLDASVSITIDTWERKRKKYTPMDTALRYMTESFPAPYFIGLSDAYANRFASYRGFEDWIRRIRLLVAASSAFQPHPLLQARSNRWDLLDDRR